VDELNDAAVVAVELSATESVVRETLVEVAAIVLALVVDVVEVVVVCDVEFFKEEDDDEDDPSGQNVINRLTLFSWHATWTHVSSGCLNALVQPAESHVVPSPSQPSYHSMRVGTLNVCGAISEMSALDPPPTWTGFVIVISNKVQSSPLKPHAPVWR